MYLVVQEQAKYACFFPRLFSPIKQKLKATKTMVHQDQKVKGKLYLWRKGKKSTFIQNQFLYGENLLILFWYQVEASYFWEKNKKISMKTNSDTRKIWVPQGRKYGTLKKPQFKPLVHKTALRWKLDQINGESLPDMIMKLAKNTKKQHSTSRGGGKTWRKIFYCGRVMQGFLKAENGGLNLTKIWPKSQHRY